MKTPTANLGSNGGPQHPDKRKADGHGPTLEDEVVFLLPASAARDWKSGASNLMDVNSRPLNEWSVNVTVDAQWLGSNGKDYGPAVRRWEEITGHPAPCPTEPGTKDNRRLNPAFSEWMMGVGPGWITDIVGSRNDALHVIGNGVVPRQAEAAFRFLMDDSNWSEDVTQTDATMTEVSKPEKPRGKCTGCDFDYQLGTARTGEHKGKLVIRKHNSRTGPGLCSGAQEPPRVEHTEGCTPEARFGPSVCSGCCDDPDQVPLTEIRLPVGPRPGGTSILADPWTAPVPAMDVENGEGEPDTRRGPWVRAAFDGECDGPCGGSLLEGDEIRADGEGGWLCQDCGADEPLRVETRTAPLPHDQWTPTGTVLDRMTPEQRVEALSTSNTVIGIHRDVMPPVSISEVHAENPPRQPDPFTAPAPASDIPESTTTVSGQPEPDRDRWGRYLIMGKAHTRATTFAKLGANTKAIEAWNERNVIRGLALRPDLLMLANGLEVKRDREQLNSIAAQAKDAAGSKVAANIGTAYHAFSERLDAGLIALQNVPMQYQSRVWQYSDALSRAGLTTRPEWIERTTAVRADQVSAPLPVAGTLDRIFQLPDGSLVIGDLKTGSDLSYGEMEIEVQLALYAHGVNTHGLFDWNTKTWQQVNNDRMPGRNPAKVRTDIAIVIHLPADGDGCTLYVADIERGWRDAQRLGQLQTSLKDKPKGKRFRTLMASDLAPRPDRGPDWSAPRRDAVPVAAPVPEPTQPSPEAAHANDQWEHAKHLFSTAPDQARIAELYQYAMDSGLFHQDQLAVLVGLGKDRLNALAKQR